jgi:hypothetical protein
MMDPFVKGTYGVLALLLLKYKACGVGERGWGGVTSEVLRDERTD